MMAAESGMLSGSRTPPTGPRAAYGPFGRMYAGRFVSSVLLQVVAVMALVEAVFLAERFPMVFRDVLKNNADLGDTATIFLLNSTQIFDLALAIAILMAVYWTIIRMRENRELLVLFAGGAGPVQLVVLVMAIAVAAMAASLTVSGALDPMSRYAQRKILFDAEFRALRSGINTGQFYYFPERVAFAPVQKKTVATDQTRKLFMYQQVSPNLFRVITADHAQLDPPNANGTISLRLDGVTSHTFSAAQAPSAAQPSRSGKTCTNCSSWIGDDPRVAMAVSSVVQQMSMDDLLTFLPRGNKAEELTVLEQVTGRGVKAEKTAESMRLLGERFARSLLCLLAPLIAMAFVCISTRRTSFVALPLACMALMALNVGSEWLVKALAPLDPFGATAVPAVVAVVIVGLLFAHVFRRQGDLVRPQLGRP